MFTTFTVTAPFGTQVRSGQLRLTREQYLPRAHALQHDGKDVYTVLVPVMFKRGETIGYAGPEEKTLRGTCEAVQKPEPKAPKEPKGPKEPKAPDAEPAA